MQKNIGSTLGKMISIVDYGVGNIFSIKKCLSKIGEKFIVTNSEIEINDSKIILLPGVGSFGYASKMLRKNNLDEVIKNNVKKGKLLIGTCVGMQLLMNKSYEKGVHTGLGLINGHVEHLKNLYNKNDKVKYPCIGYSKLNFIDNNLKIKNETNNKFFYFVHSYYVNTNKKYLVAKNKYFEKEYPAIIKKDNVIGLQFHFEISGGSGQKLISKIINHSKKIT